MAVIYCFGDSITYGAWDIEGGGWVNRLRGHLDDMQNKNESLYFLTYNLGVVGDMTDGLLRRFESEFVARKKEGQEVIFMFAFGANDSFWVPSKAQFQVPKDRFVSNIQTILDKAVKISKKIILLNITPCDEDVCAIRYNGKDKQRLNKYTLEYNELLAGLATKNSLPLVDCYSAYIKNDFKSLLSEDGLHPNQKGHELIFDLVKELF